MRKTNAVLFTLLTALAASAAPPSESPFGAAPAARYGQIRTRTEVDRKILADTSLYKTQTSTQLRTRLGFTANPSEKVEIKVELQDFRYLGSEPAAATAAQTASIGNAKGVDLLQGYVAVKEGPVKAALGRQKMQLGAGRYLSTLEWSPTSRAFDGVSGNWSQGPGDLTAFYFLVRDTSATVLNDHLALMGLNYNRKINDNLAGDLGIFYDQSELRNAYGGSLLKNYDLVYLDERVQGKFGLFTFEEEFIWQAGQGKDTTGKKLTSGAFQAAVRAGVAMPKVKANLGLDVMSGDSKPADGKTTLYRANYYFAHAYFGWMDYFAANPGYGVMDYRADVDAMLWQKDGRSASLKAQYHFFTPQDAPSGADDPYGQEIDAELHLGLYPKSNIVLGAAAFFGDKSASRLAAAKLTAGQSDRPGYFFYIMPIFNF